MPTGDGEHISQQRTPLHDTADIRDILANIVGGGYKGITDESIKGDYGRLQVLLGKPTAQKLMNHLILFNQRQGIQNKNYEQRLDEFYSTTPADNQLSDIIKKAKGFGYGYQEGVRTSSNVGNMELSGRSAKTENISMIQDVLGKVQKEAMKDKVLKGTN